MNCMRFSSLACPLVIISSGTSFLISCFPTMRHGCKRFDIRVTLISTCCNGLSSERILQIQWITNHKLHKTSLFKPSIILTYFHYHFFILFLWSKFVYCLLIILERFPNQGISSKCKEISSYILSQLVVQNHQILKCTIHWPPRQLNGEERVVCQTQPLNPEWRHP